MTKDRLVELMKNKLASIAGSLQQAEATGDVERVMQLEAERDETQITLDTLNK